MLPQQAVWLNYLTELRRRLFLVIGFFLVVFAVLFFLGAPLLHYFMWPIKHVLPPSVTLIATSLTSPILMPLQLATHAALLCTTPVALWQIWQFSAPALYRRERYHLGWLIVASFGLFLLGLLFAFYIILPYLMRFFMQAVPENIKFMPDIANVIGFMSHMLLCFGICFQLPLICVVLTRLGWVNLHHLRMVRPYVIVLAFIIGMLITPPDVFSQIIVAIPLCLLYESGLIAAKLLI